MDALTKLKGDCPDWAKRIDELGGQIDQRQAELAELAAQHQQQQEQSERPSIGRTGSSKSLRNRGSTESLRPNKNDDVEETHPGPATAPARTGPEHNKNAAQEARRASVGSRGGIDKPQRGQSNGHGSSSSPSASERQTGQAVAVASAKARATLRRTQLSRRRAAESLLSADGATPAKYRSRNLVVVYYDSHVQSFFEELVKFVSASRNLMRKAKMAARFAQIKRMAELEMPDDDDDDDDNDDPDSTSGEEPRVNGDGTTGFVAPQPAPVALRPDTSYKGMGVTNGGHKENGVGGDGELKAPSGDDKPDEDNGNGNVKGGPQAPSLATASNGNGNGNGNSNGHKTSLPSPRPTPAPMSARPGMKGGFSFSGLGFGGPQQSDIFDEIDKGLEYVQSMCEHAAHQFLRDGDCADGIVKIKDRLNETKERADREMDRLLQQGDANGAPAAKVKDEPPRSRSLRPQSMRARTSIGSRGFSIPRAESERPAGEKDEAGGLFVQPGVVLEADTSALDTDEASKPPKFQYRSTRAMGPVLQPHQP